jgi:hypothetical protein
MSKLGAFCRMETVLVSSDSNEEDFAGFTKKGVRFEERCLNVQRKFIFFDVHIK